jgi:hypothetical protein
MIGVMARLSRSPAKGGITLLSVARNKKDHLDMSLTYTKRNSF